MYYRITARLDWLLMMKFMLVWAAYTLAFYKKVNHYM